jgi:hypothetical protein
MKRNRRMCLDPLVHTYNNIGRIILKLILNKMGVDVEWIHQAQDVVYL